MIRSIFIISFILVIICLSFTSCKSLKDNTNQNGVKLPSNYSAVNDSSNSANLKWKDYFSDPILITLIDIGLKNNLDLLSASQRIEISRSQFRVAKGGLLPNVSLNAVMGQRRFGKYTMDGVGNFDTNFSPNISEDEKIKEHLPDFYLGFQSSWEIDVWGKLRNRKKASFARYLSSIEGRNYIVTNLISEIANTYYQLIALDNQLDIMKETITLQDSALSIVNLQKQVGDVNELAVKQFQAQLLNSKGLEIEVQQSIIETESKLNFLLGRIQQPVTRNKSSFNTDINQQVKFGTPIQLVQNRPDVRQAEYELKASKADVKSAKAAFFPSLTIGAAYGFQSFNPAFLFLNPQSIAYNLLGGLTAPLFNQNAIRANYKATNAAQNEAFNNYSKTVINAFNEVNVQISNISNLQKMYDYKKQETDAYITAIDASNELFLKGRASYLEVVLTQKNALQAKLDLIQTKQKQYFCLVNVYKALGGGWR